MKKRFRIDCKLFMRIVLCIMNPINVTRKGECCSILRAIIMSSNQSVGKGRGSIVAIVHFTSGAET